MEKTGLNEFLEEVGVGRTNALRIVESVGGDKLRGVELSHKVHHPVRKESRCRQHTFSTVDSFAEYIKKYGCEDTVVLVDTENRRASLTLNECAETGREFMEFVPLMHPLWKPWQQMLDGGKLGLDDFVEFLIMHSKRVEVAKHTSQELIIALSQVRASVETTIHRGRVSQKEAINGILCKTKIDGNEASELVELPDEFTVTCPLFVACDPVAVEISLLLKPVGDDIAVKLLAINLAELYAVEFAKVVLRVKEALPDCYVAFGDANYGSWDYVAEK